MKPKLSINEFIKLAVFFNVMYVVVMYVLNQSVCGVRFSNAAVFGLGITGGTLLNGLLAMANWWYPQTNKVSVIKSTPSVANPPNTPLISTVVANTPRDITSGYQSPYLNPTAVPEPITVDGKTGAMYRFADIQFDFYKMPHVILAGTSGSGKTVALFNLIGTMQHQYPDARFVVIDYGNQDFTQSYPTDVNSFLKVVDCMYYIMRGRQQEGKQTTRTRIIWVVEEFESVLGEIKLLPKAEREQFFARLANIGRMARKLHINMVFVTQSAKAEDMNTSLRNNFANRFLLNMENNSLANALGCAYNVGGLPTGIAYNSAIKAFVQFPLATEPHMDMIPYTDLMRLGNFYRNKYQLDTGEVLS